MTDGRDIVIAAVGRFHYDALATGLDRHGRLLRFYSGLPRQRLRCPEIARHKVITFPWLQVPYMAMARYSLVSTRLGQRLARVSQQALDLYISRNLPDCSAYAAMSGCGLYSGAEAKRRGIRYVCERGAAHIRYNDDLMRAESARWGIPYTPTEPRMIEREEAEYALADRVVVLTEANTHSYIEQGVAAEKLRVVAPSVLPAGTPGPLDRGPGLRVLFVGALSLAKGLGYLAEAFRQADLPDATLVLVGNSGPESDRLLRGGNAGKTTLVGPLPHQKVLEEMRRAHVLVLPSVTDGWGLVVTEALACGCPVVVSDACGSSELVVHGQNGLIVPAKNSDALAAALVKLNEDRDLLLKLTAGAVASAPQGSDLADYAARWCSAVAS